MEKCFDIIPHSNGWIYLLEGQASASYPSYSLALKAARAHAARETDTLRRIVFRRLELNGQMSAVKPGPHHSAF